MAVNPPAPPPLIRPRCRSPRAARGAATGFTLVEVLMAIAVSCLVMGAAAAFVFSCFKLLTDYQTDPQFENHKLAVCSYLTYAFNNAPPSANNSTISTLSSAAVASNSTAGGNTSSATGAAGTTGGLGRTTRNQTNRVVWGYPPSDDVSTTDPYLTFRVDDDTPLLVWDKGIRPPATAWLYFKEGEGLSIIWQTDEQASNPLGTDNAVTIQRTEVSPLVTKMEFFYYDPNSQDWTNGVTPQTDPTTGLYLLPNYIRLTFTINGKDEPMTVNIPTPQSGSPIY